MLLYAYLCNHFIRNFTTLIFSINKQNLKYQGAILSESIHIKMSEIYFS